MSEIDFEVMTGQEDEVEEEEEKIHGRCNGGGDGSDDGVDHVVIGSMSCRVGNKLSFGP